MAVICIVDNYIHTRRDGSRITINIPLLPIRNRTFSFRHPFLSACERCRFSLKENNTQQKSLGMQTQLTNYAIIPDFLRHFLVTNKLN